MPAHRHWCGLKSGGARILTSQPTKETDFFGVKFAHVEYAFYISPADADGKIRALAMPLHVPHDPLQLGG